MMRIASYRWKGYMQTSSEAEQVSLTEPVRHSFLEVLKVWLALGFQSFGGGSSTLFLIRRAIVTNRGWVGEDEFLRFWSLVQIAPGINLIAMAILLGNRIGGWSGIAACVLGLLVPSAAITILLTAVFSSVQELPAVQAALRGIVPAAAGLSLALGLDMAIPLFRRSRREGRTSIATSLGIIAGCAILLAVLKVSVIILLFVSGVIGALIMARYEEPKQ